MVYLPTLSRGAVHLILLAKDLATCVRWIKWSWILLSSPEEFNRSWKKMGSITRFLDFFANASFVRSTAIFCTYHFFAYCFNTQKSELESCVFAFNTFAVVTVLSAVGIVMEIGATLQSRLYVFKEKELLATSKFHLPKPNLFDYLKGLRAGLCYLPEVGVGLITAYMTGNMIRLAQASINTVLAVSAVSKVYGYIYAREAEIDKKLGDKTIQEDRANTVLTKSLKENYSPQRNGVKKKHKKSSHSVSNDFPLPLKKSSDGKGSHLCVQEGVEFLNKSRFSKGFLKDWVDSMLVQTGCVQSTLDYITGDVPTGYLTLESAKVLCVNTKMAHKKQ